MRPEPAVQPVVPTPPVNRRRTPPQAPVRPATQDPGPAFAAYAQDQADTHLIEVERERAERDVEAFLGGVRKRLAQGLFAARMLAAAWRQL